MGLLAHVRSLDRTSSLGHRPRSIEPYEELPIGEDLVVTIYASDGTATASIPSKEICKTLSRLNRVIEVERAHWEFEYFRRGCGCHVRGYKFGAYPNDR